LTEFILNLDEWYCSCCFNPYEDKHCRNLFVSPAAQELGCNEELADCYQSWLQRPNNSGHYLRHLKTDDNEFLFLTFMTNLELQLMQIAVSIDELDMLPEPILELVLDE